MKEKKNNYLAINKTSVSIKWLTIASLVYLLIYTEAGDIVTAFSELWAPILYLVIVCFLALGAKIFYKTDRVFIKLPKEGQDLNHYLLYYVNGFILFNESDCKLGTSL